MKESIVRLRALEKQRFAYRYALNVVDFDAETVAPEGSADGRAEACEVLSRADFDLLVNDDTAALLRQASQDAETEQERAEVRELQRTYDQISKIPADEYAAFTKLTQQSVPAWVKAKRTNDFSVFAPYLEKIVAARRAQARYFAPDRDPYEVLLDQYEHGLTIAQCDEFFATLRETIVPLLADIRARGAAIRTDFLDQDWPIDAQRKVSEKIMQLGPGSGALLPGRERAPLYDRVLARRCAHHHPLHAARHVQQPVQCGARGRPCLVRAKHRPRLRLHRRDGRRDDGHPREPEPPV